MEIPMLEVSEEEARSRRPVVSCDGLLVCADCGLVLGRVYVIQYELDNSNI